MSGFEELDRMIASVRKLGAMPEDLAKRASPAVAEALKATAGAGETPEGVPWAPKKGGGQPLANAAAAIEVSARGTVIQARLVGTSTGSQKVQAIQHYGSKSIIARNILPASSGGIPPRILEALQTEATKLFKEAVAP